MEELKRKYSSWKKERLSKSEDKLTMSPKSGGGGGIYRTIGWRHFIYGGIASCVAECGTFPLDLTKTRLQVQGQQAKHLISCGVSPVRSTYRGTLDALIKISREEGVPALYRGISPALLRQSVYGTLKFGAYYSLKRLLPEENVASNMLCAVVAGMTSSAIANPTDVLKVRMQVASANPSMHSTSLFSAFRKIYRFEGISGLWRGVGPTSQRAGIIAAVELPVYDGCKQYFIRNDILNDAPPNHIISSFVASLAAAVASTPVDVIRTRLMSQKLVPTDSYGREAFPEASRLLPPQGKIYRGSWECLVTTVKHEGVLALYKGFVPAWIRMGPWNLLFFTTYEQLLRYF